MSREPRRRLPNLLKDFSPKAAMLGAGLVPVVAVVVAGIMLLSGGGSSADTSRLVVFSTPTPAAIAASTPPATAGATAAAPSPTPHIPGSDQNDRIIITKANVDAPITYKDVPPQGGALPSPDTPDDVAFYDFDGFQGFGGYPGAGGNSIFSGHVDSGHKACKNGTVQPPCEAVFWDINKLKQGDIIELRLGDATYEYSVTGGQDIKADDVASWANVFKSTPTESITLITCAGDFNRSTGEYDSRHVVTAARVPDTARTLTSYDGWERRYGWGLQQRFERMHETEIVL